MPELPEVQILVNQLAPRLERARIRAVESRDPKIKLDRHLVGRRIDRVRRQGKNIVFDLSGGLHLLVHLRMTGWFEFERPKRYRAAIHTTRGTAYFEDARRLGTMRIMTRDNSIAPLKNSGPIRWWTDAIFRGCKPHRVPSKSRCLTSNWSRASATSTPANRCGGHESIHVARRTA